jgi:hypothetical protein
MNQYKVKLHIYVLMLITVIIASCTPKNSTRMRSFVDDNFEQEMGDVQVQQTAETMRLKELLLEIEPLVAAQFQLEIDQVDANMLFSRTVIPLRDIVLNQDYMMNPNHRYARLESGQFIMPRLVSLFNQSLLLIQKSQPSLIESTDLLTRYKKIIFWDCDQQLRGSCEFVRVFRSMDSVNMSSIMKWIHDREDNDDERYRIILATYDLKNRRIDSVLRFMLLERLARSLEIEQRGTITTSRLSQDADLFANLLQVNVQNMRGEERYLNLVQGLNPWILSRNVDSSHNPAMTNIIRLASRQLLYEQNGGLSQVIRNQVIPNILFTVGNDYEQGVEFQKANIRGEWKPEYKRFTEQLSVNPANARARLTSRQSQVFEAIQNVQGVDLYNDKSQGILTTLLADVNFVHDEYFFLVHQSYYGHFNLDDSSAFWDNSNKDTGRLMRATVNLLKMQLVNNIVMTNNRMNDFYERNQNNTLIELLRESDKEASQIRKAWTRTLARAQSMKNFINRVVNPNILSQEDRAIFDHINSSVDALTKNIKFLVTYPNMFPLMHVMSSLEMRDTVRTWFGSFNIDSLTVIQTFFAGRFPPWFNFGNDGDHLDSVEIIYTYYYALVTQIFETYSTNTLVQFSHRDFFREVVKKLIQEEENHLDEARRSLSAKINEFRNAARMMIRACNEEMPLQLDKINRINELKSQLGDDFDWSVVLRELEASQNRRQIRNEIEFVNLDGYLYGPADRRSDKIGHYLGQIYSSQNNNTFNLMRINFPQKNMVAQTLLEVYRQTNPGHYEEVDQVFQQQFMEYERLKAEFTQIFSEADQQIRDCDWAFIERDRDIRHQLIFREAEYLGGLFDDLWELFSLLTEEQRANFRTDQDLQSQLENIRRAHSQYTQRSVYPAEYSSRHGYTRIDPNRVTSFKMDMAARVYAYLEELFPGQYSITMPPDFRNVALYRENSPSVVLLDWTHADKNRAKSEFVKAGIRALASQMEWARTSPFIGHVRQRGDIMVTLFRLGALNKIPGVDCHSQDLSADEFERSCMKVSASDLIDHFARIINFINIDERDEIILDLIGSEQKYHPSIYESFIKRDNGHELYSYYDVIFRRVFAEGHVTETDSAWFSEPLVKYVNSVHKIVGSTFIFTYPEDINQIFMGNYNSWLTNYYDVNREFLDEVKLRLDQGVEPFTFKYNINRSHRIGTERNDRSQNTNVSLEPLISDLFYSKFDGLSQKINNDTSGYFSDILQTYRQEFSQLVAPNSGDER